MSKKAKKGQNRGVLCDSIIRPSPYVPVMHCTQLRARLGLTEMSGSQGSLSSASNSATDRSVNQGGDMMTTAATMKQLSILRHDMNDEVFMQLWPQFYQHHMYGGYNEEQMAIWNTNPFAFVLKWPLFVDYAVSKTQL